MLFIQIKKLSLLIIIAFLIIVLLNFHVQVEAETTDMRDKAQTLWERGKIAFNERNYQTSLEKFNNSLTIYKELGDRQSEADILTWLAVVNVDTDLLVDAQNYLKESQEIYDNLNSRPGEKAAVKDVDKAMQALMFFSEGSSFEKNEDYKSALKKYQYALELVREIRERRYEADILTRMGDVQCELKNYPEAENYYRKALSIYRELDNKSRNGSVLINIGALYYDWYEYVKSLSYFKSAINIFEEIGDNERLANALNWAGTTYVSLSEFSNALDYYRRALAIYQKLGFKKKVRTTTRRLVDTSFLMGNNNIPRELYEQALNRDYHGY